MPDYLRLFLFNHKMTYAEKLRDPRWQKKRLQIFNRDKFTCKLCKDKSTTLQVHHLEYHGEPWETPNKHLITLCEHCHMEVESLKKSETNFYFQNFAIHKITFVDGSRIMFFSHMGEFYQRIYDENGKVMVGFKCGNGLDASVIGLKKLLKSI